MFLLIFITAFVALLLTLFYRKVWQHPPGPTPWPLLGNIPHMAWGLLKYGNVVDTMRQWKEQYGNLVTFWIGHKPLIMVMDYDLAKDVFVTHGAMHSNRLVMYIVGLIRRGMGIVFANGHYWQEHRRFVLRTLRNLGLGKNLIEQRILEEFESSISRLDSDALSKGIEVDASRFFNQLAGNIINRMLFSERFGQRNEEEFFALKANLDQLLNRVTVLDLFISDYTKNLPFFKQRVESFIAPQKKLEEFVVKRVTQRQLEIKSGQHVVDGEGDDYVDAYFIKMREEENLPKEERLFPFDGLFYDVMDLWFAGHETTSNTMMWAFIFLLNDKKIIDDVYEELYNFTGGSRFVTLPDRVSTPKLNAVIMETQRLASIIRMNLIRLSTEQFTIGKYSFPEGTALAAQLSLILSEESIFKDAKKFDPYRFLRDESIQSHVIPFGVGKRSCLGESLARDELYLIISNMILRYNFDSIGEPPKAVAIKSTGFIHRPVNYKMKLTLREQ